MKGYIVVDTYQDMQPDVGERIIGFAASVAGVKQLIERDQAKCNGYLKTDDYDVYALVARADEFLSEGSG